MGILIAKQEHVIKNDDKEKDSNVVDADYEVVEDDKE